MTQTRAQAAQARAAATKARADRPRQRRSAEAPGSLAVVRVRMTDARVTRSVDSGSATFAGYASITETPYEMYDWLGPYTEVVSRGGFTATLAADPQVELVVNHGAGGGIPLAHTRNGTLRLSEDEQGLRAEAELDATRHDVHDVLAALERGDLAEMSFRFMITSGQWSPDYSEYRINAVDLDRGDVSIVNFGANPHTYIETPARQEAVAGIEARDQSSAARALGDEPAEQPTNPEKELTQMSDPVAIAAQPVEPEVRSTDLEENQSLRARIEHLEEQARIRTAAEAARSVTGNTPKYDQVARVGAEARTYSPESDRTGRQFLSDVVRNALGEGFEARERLMRHMQEERVERGGMVERAAGTTAFAGLVVPQYLTDLVAPAAKAGRPFADAIRRLPLPDQGMTVEISQITTATTTAVQTQANAVSETDIDDTKLSVAVQTIGGSQTVTRQAVERGSSVLDTVLEDLARSYSTTLDSTLINQGTNGLTNVATSIAYTDASPTAAELYPKLLQGTAAVEAALLDQQAGDTIAVMHSRRWYWLQAALSSTFPLIAQPNVPFNVAGQNYGTRYGSGYRGVLPSGVPVIVDNNIATNLGAGTNEDEIYFVGANDIFLWEDTNAPMMIRTEIGPSIKSLGVDIVVYGYIAYTHVRRAHAQKIAGTGLVTPAWA